MTSKKLSLEKLSGEIAKLTELRSAARTTDEFCSYTLQLRHYKTMYEKAQRQSMTYEKIRRFNDRGAI